MEGENRKERKPHKQHCCSKCKQPVKGHVGRPGPSCTNVTNEGAEERTPVQHEFPVPGGMKRQRDEEGEQGNPELETTPERVHAQEQQEDSEPEPEPEPELEPEPEPTMRKLRIPDTSDMQVVVDQIQALRIDQEEESTPRQVKTPEGERGATAGGSQWDPAPKTRSCAPEAVGEGGLNLNPLSCVETCKSR